MSISIAPSLICLGVSVGFALVTSSCLEGKAKATQSAGRVARSAILAKPIFPPLPKDPKPPAPKEPGTPPPPKLPSPVPKLPLPTGSAPFSVPISRVCSAMLHRQRGSSSVRDAVAGVTATACEIQPGGNTCAQVVATFESEAEASVIRQQLMNLVELELPIPLKATGNLALVFCDKLRPSCFPRPGSQLFSDPLRGPQGELGPLAFAIGSSTTNPGVFRVGSTGAEFLAPGPVQVLYGGNFLTAGGAYVPEGEDEYALECDEYKSPLFIDLGGTGLSLTPPTLGVRFDINADGTEETISWTTQSNQVFLALDLNGNGRIDHGGELFGDSTLGPDGKRASNGFLALAKYDRTEHGGNSDGRIDRLDSIYARLLTWASVPETPGGVIQTLSLSPMAAQGIEAIDLDYIDLKTPETDPYGNQTRQRSTVSLIGGTIRVIYDVFFRVP